MVDVGVGAEVVGKVGGLWGLSIQRGGAIHLSCGVDFCHTGYWLLLAGLLGPCSPVGCAQQRVKPQHTLIVLGVAVIGNLSTLYTDSLL